MMIKKRTFEVRTKERVIIDDNPLLVQTIDMCLGKRGHDVKVFYQYVIARLDTLSRISSLTLSPARF